MIEYFSVFRKSWLLKQSQRLQDWCQEHLCLTIIICINKYQVGVESLLALWRDRERRRMNAWQTVKRLRRDWHWYTRLALQGPQRNRIIMCVDTWPKGKTVAIVFTLLFTLFCLFLLTPRCQPYFQNHSIEKQGVWKGKWMSQRSHRAGSRSLVQEPSLCLNYTVCEKMKQTPEIQDHMTS